MTRQTPDDRTRLNVLFCYSRIPSFTNAVRDYVEAFGRHSRHQIHYFDMDGGRLDFDLSRYQAIIFNYCFWGRCLQLDDAVMKRIATFQGSKIAIFQDEYDYFLWHRQNVRAMAIDTIVTGVPKRHWSDVYGSLTQTITFIDALTGYVPDSLLSAEPRLPLNERRYWVGYRGRPVPFSYGRLTQEKVVIGREMHRACKARAVPCDIEIGEEDRLYGDAWTNFIGDCRTVLGTESGSNVFDFSGTVKTSIANYLKDEPDADFETVHEKFLASIDGVIEMNQVSPRIFEAIALGTGLILFEGTYSDVVQPWTHFIPLRKDFSNLDEVLAAVEDTAGLQTMIDRARADVIENPRYHFLTFIQKVDDHLSRAKSSAMVATPVLGVVGWRTADGVLSLEPPRSLYTRSSIPLRHTDIVRNPVVLFRINVGEARQRLMRMYVNTLQSSSGRRIHDWLRKHDRSYAGLRRLIRTVTGRGM